MEKKTAALLSLSIAAATITAHADCRDVYHSQKDRGFFSRLSSDAQEGIAGVSFTGGFYTSVIYTAFTGATALTAVAIAFPIAASPILVSEGIAAVKNAHLIRMIHLVNQSERYLKTGHTLRTPILNHLYRQVGSDKTSMEALATAIVHANNDGSLCSRSSRYKELKKDIEAGNFNIVELPPVGTAKTDMPDRIHSDGDHSCDDSCRALKAARDDHARLQKAACQAALGADSDQCK